MATKVGEAYVELTARAGKFRAEMSKAAARTGSFIQQAGGKLKAFGKTAFKYAIAGAAALTAAMTKAAHAAAEEELQTKRLHFQMERVNASSARQRKEVEEVAAQWQRLSRFGDTDTRKTLTTLITLTNDYESSLKNLDIVFGMAESGMFDINSAARYVGMAMSGNIEILGRYISELKTTNNEQLKYMSTQEKARYAIDLLRKKFGGLAQEVGDTTAGAWAKMRNAVSDAWEALGTGVLDGVNEGLGNLTNGLKEIEPELRKVGELIGKLVTEASSLISKYGKFLGGEVSPGDVWFMGPAWMAGAKIAQDNARETLAVEKESAEIIQNVMETGTERLKKNFRERAEEVKMSSQEQADWLKRIVEPLKNLTEGTTDASQASKEFQEIVQAVNKALEEYGKKTEKVTKQMSRDWVYELGLRTQSLLDAEKRHKEKLAAEEQAERDHYNTMSRLYEEYARLSGDEHEAERLRILREYKIREEAAEGHADVIKQINKNMWMELEKNTRKATQEEVAAIRKGFLEFTKEKPLIPPEIMYGKSFKKEAVPFLQPKWVGASELWRSAMTSAGKRPEEELVEISEDILRVDMEIRDRLVGVGQPSMSE